MIQHAKTLARFAALALASTFAGTFTGALTAQQVDDERRPELRIKPAVMVRGMHVQVGDLCEITPLNATTQAISEIRFGPAPRGGFARTVDRTDVVRMLAAAGVPLATVQLSGSPEVVVQGLMVDVPPQQVLDAATVSLQALLETEGGDVEFELPNDLRRLQAPPGRVSQELRARVRDNRTQPTFAIVDVEVLIDGEVFQKLPVRYHLTRYQRVLKTIGPIERETPLGPENVALVREPMAQVGGMILTDMKDIAGMTASRRLTRDRVLMLGDIEPPAVIRAGDVVTVVLTRGRIKITASAIANHDAALGARIHLTNPKSRAQVLGTVYAPGMVVVRN